MNQFNALEAINKIKINLSEIENFISSNYSPNINESNQVDELEELFKLLNSNEWPEAVSEFQIADENSEEEKNDRAEGIVDILIQESLENKKFLDFGCGEGHMAKYASKEAETSVGYDIQKSEKSIFAWEEKENNLLLTTNFEKVKKEGPYDVILIYDVIDHLSIANKTEKFQKAAELLMKAGSVLKENGNIYLRCHPWSSRHAGHLYREINKAFIHLVFSEKELEKLNMNNYKENKDNLGILFPISEYEKIIREAGLKPSEPEIEHQEVETFFKENNIISNRLKNMFSTDKFPEFQMSQCFLDYVLTKE